MSGTIEKAMEECKRHEKVVQELAAFPIDKITDDVRAEFLQSAEQAKNAERAIMKMYNDIMDNIQEKFGHKRIPQSFDRKDQFEIG